MRPLVAERITGRECKVVDSRLAEKVNRFILEMLDAGTDSLHERSRKIHQLGLRPARNERRDDQAELEEAVGDSAATGCVGARLDSAGCD